MNIVLLFYLFEWWVCFFVYTYKLQLGSNFCPVCKKTFFYVPGRSSFDTNILGVLTRALGIPIRDLGVLTRTQQLVRRFCLECNFFQPKSKSAKNIV